MNITISETVNTVATFQAINRLSKLQRGILLRALRSVVEYVAPDDDDGGPRLYFAEIYRDVLGWPMERKWYEPKSAAERCYGPGEQAFRPSQIGRERYNVGHAAVSRSVRRLEERGLLAFVRGVHFPWTAIALTDAGIALAGRLANMEGGPTDAA